MSETTRARAFTFISDREEGLTLSIVLPDRHLFIKVTDSQAALALAQLADHHAEVARKSLLCRPAFAEEAQPPCDT